MPFRKYSSFHAAFHFSFLENVLLPPSNQYIYISLSLHEQTFLPTTCYLYRDNRFVPRKCNHRRNDT